MFHKGSKEKQRGIGFGGFTVSSKPKQQILRPSPVQTSFALRTGKQRDPGHSENTGFKRP